MYLHFKSGFVEVDQWDGTMTGDAEHDGVLSSIGKHPIPIVVRSRTRSTLVHMATLFLHHYPGAPLSGKYVYESPKGWDYEFRSYYTKDEFACIMTQIVMDLDYRNFKSWTAEHAPAQRELAGDIWHVAHQQVREPRILGGGLPRVPKKRGGS